jgi:hypothetical protein
MKSTGYKESLNQYQDLVNQPTFAYYLGNAFSKVGSQTAMGEAQRMSKAMRVNYMNAMQDISIQRANVLGQRNLAAPEQMVVMETTGGIVNSSSNIMATGFATSMMSGLSSGIGAYRAAK